MCHVSRFNVRRLGVAFVLFVLMSGAGQSLHAQSGPASDPAGILTGDKSSVTDAGGGAFVVSEPFP